jgi:murein DD-endopeptidase MepM/ murein hydrolase activator NlpD
MAKTRYRFNPDTLSFEKVERSFMERLFYIFRYLVIFLVSALVFNVIYTRVAQTPKQVILLREQQALLAKFDVLNKELDRADDLLLQLQQRDDHVYRAVFEVPPIPSTVREAGFGGANRYEHLYHLENSSVVVESAKKMDILLKKIYIQSKSYDEVIALSENMEQMITSIPAIQPIALKDMSRISSYFGIRRDPFRGVWKFHEGMDFTGPIGTEVFATGDGVVIASRYSRWGYGNEIIIDHGFSYISRYAHLNKSFVKTGQRVKRGEVIGTLGNTGRSTGAHLHYEVRKNNRPINPINFYFDDITPEQYELMVKRSAEEGGMTMD